VQIRALASRLATLFLIVSLTSFPTSPSAQAQGVATADDAIRQAVANAKGAGPDTLIIRVIGERTGWVYASATVPATTDEDAPIVTYVLAHENRNGWFAELRYTDAFNQLLQQAPADFPNANVRSALNGISLAGDGSADLSFPFPVGETWRFNGPHPNGAGRPWSSLDFYRPASGGFAWNAPILAMRGGVVDLPCANMVVIDHGDGWSTYYYHVINMTVADGQTVSRGQQVGGTSDQFNCGGAANGPHSHIWMTWQGTEVVIAGKDIGGWTVSNGAVPYGGCLTREAVVRCAEAYATITNDGTSGSFGSLSISPARSTVNNWITWSLDQLPANSTGEIRWQRLSGSTIVIDTFLTSGSGSASGQFRVPATPGGPNQLISFVVGSIIRSTTFEVAPRIKVNTSPGQRGAQVDVSLRGYAKNEVVRIRWYRPGGAWVQLGTVTTSNTGSANLWVTVPGWAPDGANSVRGDGTTFRQQTNVVMINGGDPVQTAEISETPIPTSEASPSAETPAASPTQLVIDHSALPTDPTTVGPVVPSWTLDPASGTLIATTDLGSLMVPTTIGWLVTDPACTQLTRLETSADGLTWGAIDLPSAPVPGVWQTVTGGEPAQFVRWVTDSADPALANICLAEFAVWAIPAEPISTETPIAPTPDAETGTPVPASDSSGEG
jgi:murein DD-endopeptidase MepM/ murein hydrolase activator NlpD